GGNSSADLTWTAVNPLSLVQNYKVYVEPSPFSSVIGLTPKLSVPKSSVSTQVAGLENGTTYYVAVTTKNISGGEDPVVSSVSVTPQQDTVGPQISNITFAGAPLVPGTMIGKSGIIALSATDPSGVSRVDISINNGTQTTLLSSLSGAGPIYSTNWNIIQLAEGPYTVLIDAFDSLDNATNKQLPVTIQFLPPEPPVITSPVSSTITTESIIELIGNSTVGTTVDIFRAGQPLVGGLVVNSNGNFATNIALIEGDNVFTAKANGVGGQSASSAPVTIKLDTSVPEAPTGLNSYSKKNGEIRLDWLGSQSPSPITYDVYRSNLSFSEIEEAEKVNSTPITSTTFSDFPEVDGTYYYRVVANNSVGTSSDLSNQTVANSDSIPPKATEIAYTTDTFLDPLTDVVGPGIVNVKVTVSEKLLAVPFLSYAFAQGSPINVTLVQSGETEYQGTFEVTELTANGLGTAVFSARDLVSNQGSEVEIGSTIMIDSRGPEIETITVVPAAPIKNDSQSPVAVTATFDLSEDVADGTTPEFKYLLSQTVLKPAA
ncbi:MAG: hypothetical protein KDD53_09915, partial [Bdellovibrionales bacterium]|nr:hypothetical protein [Bdellovibrionales bacterium]